jgi:hypothetical protein
LEKLVHLVGVTIGIHYDARTCEHQILLHVVCDNEKKIIWQVGLIFVLRTNLLLDKLVLGGLRNKGPNWDEED